MENYAREIKTLRVGLYLGGEEAGRKGGLL